MQVRSSCVRQTHNSLTLATVNWEGPLGISEASDRICSILVTASFKFITCERCFWDTTTSSPCFVTRPLNCIDIAPDQADYNRCPVVLYHWLETVFDSCRNPVSRINVKSDFCLRVDWIEVQTSQLVSAHSGCCCLTFVDILTSWTTAPRICNC